MAGRAQVEWQSFEQRRSGVRGVMLAFVPEVPGAEVQEHGSTVGAGAFADGGVGQVFPERGGCVESGEPAADGGLADASVAVAGEERDVPAGGLTCAFVLGTRSSA